jgi:hypothetical protein
MTKHHCTLLDTGLVCRYRVVTRLQLFTSFVPTPSLKLVVFVTVHVTKCTLVTFHIKRVCTVLHFLYMVPRLMSIEGVEP